MFYCPKCQQTYDEGMQRFCSNDGGRLLPAPSSGKSVNQSNGVFTNLLGRVVPGNEKDEKLSSIPRFVRVEPTKPAQSNFRPPTENNIFKIDRELKPETEAKPQTQKPLPRIIKPSEIPASQARLGDRKTNPTGRLAITWENPDVLLGQTVKGRYQVIKKFEQDETSIAYLAEDEIVPNKKVVVRVLMDEDEADNFTNKIFAEERVSLSLINHPNIARILDSGELLEGKPFIVSEFTEGESVKEMLRKTGQFNALRTSRIISQTADALSTAHQNGVLHRNLKPENIVLTISEAGNEQVKLINFGISKDNLNKENIAYKSPEQLEGKLANYASDIYSLAVIAYQMLTNRLPFNGSSVDDLLKSQREGLSLSPTNLCLDMPPSVDKILEKGLEVNPSDRYPKARDFGDALFNSLKAGAPREDEKETKEIEIITDENEENLEATPSLLTSEEEMKTVKPETLPMSVSAAVFNDATKETNVKTTEELSWEKRSPEPLRVSSWSFTLISILGILLLLAGIWGVWSYLLNRPPESEMIQTPTETVFPIETENAKTSMPKLEEIEVPPLPRTISQPPDTTYFQNSKEGMKGDLVKNFLGFSLYYPEDWKQNDAKGKFLDISKEASSGTPIEQMLISYYDSKGTLKTDTELFPSLVKETNSTLKEIVPNYEMVSEGEKAVNNGWRAYEVKFKGAGKTAKGENITLWGRRFFIPSGRPGMKNGYVITMLATSLSPEVKNVDDVGVKGELSTVLETFEPNQNF
ncbi:MAG: serine/threonine protein kinase [Pyrinomonadaceae bacterium]